MKNLLLGLVLISSISAFAGPKTSCRVVNGSYDNSLITPKEPVLMESNGQEGFDTFSLSSIEDLKINVFGKLETFVSNATSISGGTKIDFSLKSAPEQVKAVLMVSKTPGRINKRFKALLVITGTKIDLSANNAPLFGASSLVYNLSCKNL